MSESNAIGEGGLLPAETTSSERNFAVLAHLSMLAGLVMPLGNIGAPIIMRFTKGFDSEFIAAHATEAVNFQISITLYLVVCVATIVRFQLGSLLLIPWLGFVLLAVIRACLAARRGELHRYPLTIRLLR